MRPPVCCVSARLPPESACQRSTATAPASSKCPCASDSSSAQRTSRSSSSSSSSSTRSAIVCRSKRASLSAREERVVRKRERLLDAVDELVPAPLGNRVALRDRPRAALVAHEPARDLRVLAELDPEPGPRDLRPDVRLMPVHPAAAELDVGVVPAVRPGAATQPVARLEEKGGGPAQGRLAGGGDAREPTADDDDVVHGRRIYPRLTAGKSRVVSGPCGGRRCSSRSRF